MARRSLALIVPYFGDPKVHNGEAESRRFFWQGLAKPHSGDFAQWPEPCDEAVEQSLKKRVGQSSHSCHHENGIEILLTSM
jgi:hypothetical protein